MRLPIKPDLSSLSKRDQQLAGAILLEVEDAQEKIWKPFEQWMHHVTKEGRSTLLCKKPCETKLSCNYTLDNKKDCPWRNFKDAMGKYIKAMSKQNIGKIVLGHSIVDKFVCEICEVLSSCAGKDCRDVFNKIIRKYINAMEWYYVFLDYESSKALLQEVALNLLEAWNDQKDLDSVKEDCLRKIKLVMDVAWGFPKLEDIYAVHSTLVRMGALIKETDKDDRVWYRTPDFSLDEYKQLHVISEIIDKKVYEINSINYLEEAKTKLFNSMVEDAKACGFVEQDSIEREVLNALGDMDYMRDVLSKTIIELRQEKERAIKQREQLLEKKKNILISIKTFQKNKMVELFSRDNTICGQHVTSIKEIWVDKNDSIKITQEDYPKTGAMLEELEALYNEARDDKILTLAGNDFWRRIGCFVYDFCEMFEHNLVLDDGEGKNDDRVCEWLTQRVMIQDSSSKIVDAREIIKDYLEQQDFFSWTANELWSCDSETYSYRRNLMRWIKDNENKNSLAKIILYAVLFKENCERLNT